MTVYYVISLPKIPYICCLCTALANVKHMGWSEACMYTVYDRILCDFPTKNTVYSLSMYGSGQRKQMGWPKACMCTVYDRIFCDFPAKSTVYLLSMYGSGQR